MSIKVIKGGMITTLQDLGRYGWQSLGFSVGGAMDPFALRLANIILGNDEGEAALEMTMVGPELEFQSHAVIALFGADMSASLDGIAVKHGMPIQVTKGAVLKMKAAGNGARCYLAIKGGFAIQRVLNSKSTDVKATIGGLYGRQLQTGDYLPIHHPQKFPSFNWGLSQICRATFSKKYQSLDLREADSMIGFQNEAKRQFISTPFEVSNHSDRMGYRLIGPAIKMAENRELVTEGTDFGSIQVPPNGQPIILMADRQPTGGYPKIGQVIQSDIPKIGQLRPGQKLRFQEVALHDAQWEIWQTYHDLLEIKAAASLKWKEIENAYH